MKIRMLVVDIMMMLTLLTLFAPLLTGILVHEFAGMVFFFLVIFHLLLSWSWITMAVKNLFGSAPIRKKFNCLLNLLLYISVLLQVISGLVMSHSLLPLLGIKTYNDLHWRGLHNQAFQFIVILLCMHIALNWTRIAAYFTRRSKSAHNIIALSLVRVVSATSTIKRIFFRILILLFIGLAVFLLTWWLFGQPVTNGPEIQVDIEKFQPRLIPGIVQYTGAVIVISILSYMAKRWLKLRL